MFVNEPIMHGYYAELPDYFVLFFFCLLYFYLKSPQSPHFCSAQNTLGELMHETVTNQYAVFPLHMSILTHCIDF